MSEGVFLLPRVSDDQSGNGIPLLKHASPTTAVGTAGVNISTKQGRLYKIRVVNTAASTNYYVMLVDKATAPVNGDSPKYTITVKAASDAEDRWDMYGLYFANGCGLAISTTANVVTLAATSDCYVSADYTQVT